MSREIQAQGKYTHKESGQDYLYEFSYTAIDSVEDAIASLGEDKVKSLIQRQVKVDANNTAREKEKAKNGHSSRQPMSEEDKASKKAERQSNKVLLDALKAKGITLEDLAGM